MTGTGREGFGSCKADVSSRIEYNVAGLHEGSKEMPIYVGLRIAEVEQEPECVAPFMWEAEIESKL